MNIEKSNKYLSPKTEKNLDEVRDSIANLLDIPNNQKEAEELYKNSYIEWKKKGKKDDVKYYFDIFIWNGFYYEGAHMDSYIHDDGYTANCYYKDITDIWHAMAVIKQALNARRIIENTKGSRYKFYENSK